MSICADNNNTKLRGKSMGLTIGNGVYIRFPCGSEVKASACNSQFGRSRFNPWVRKIPWRRKWQPTPVFLPGESHGRRSLVGYSPQGRKESDTTERLHSLTHSLTVILKINYMITPKHVCPASLFLCSRLLDSQASSTTNMNT